MKKKISKTLLSLAAFAALGPVWASHGKLGSTDRDSWIDDNLAQLEADGLLPKQDKPLRDLTNLQVALLTQKAAEIYLAQAEIPALPGGDSTGGGTAASADMAAPDATMEKL